MSASLNQTQPNSVIGNGATTLTTATFNVQAATYLVAMIGADNAAASPVVGTVSDNRGGVWTLLKRSNTNNTTAEIWGSYYASPATGITVSASFTGAFSSAADAVLTVRLVSGASRNQPGTTASASGTVSTASLSARETGSRIFGMLARAAGATSYVANANSTAITLNADATSGSTQWSFTGATTSINPTAVAYGSSTTAATSTEIVVVEIVPSNGQSNNYQALSVGNGMSTGEKIR